MQENKKFVTRFAPSPTGWLHLGHAYSALMAAHCAQAANGQFLLRIEDIDSGRVQKHFIEGIYQDLDWLGLSWPQPVMHQSTRLEIYAAALDRLREMELVYPCWATRSEIRTAIAKQSPNNDWPHDPDGAPLYPGLYRDISEQRRKELMWESGTYAWRLNIKKALKLAEDKIGAKLSYLECGAILDTAPMRGAGTAPMRIANTAPMRIKCAPLDYGDVVLARKDIATSYHLAVVLDDAAQNITQVTRGMDLQPATAIHRLLQVLLDLPEPNYFHHQLVRDTDGRRLSKQAGDYGFRDLRQSGMSRAAMLTLLPPPFGHADFLPKNK